MEKRGARIFWWRRTATPAKDLPRLRDARRHQRYALPPVWRQLAIFSRSPEQKTFRPFRRARSSCDHRPAHRQHLDVWRELGDDHASGRSRRPPHALGHEWRSILSIGGEPSVLLPPPGASMVAAG